MTIKDSQLEGFRPNDINYRNASKIIEAIDTLNSRFNNGEVAPISLTNYISPIVPDEPIISYKIIDYTTLHNSLLPDRLELYTSHYIGRYRYGDVNISIQPRFGEPALNYMLQYVANVYVTPDSSGSELSSSNFYWLIALLWRSFLNNALSVGHTPKTYIRETKNIKNFRGRLNISKHITANLTDQSRFYCTYNKLTADNTINRAIRYTFKLLSEEHCTPIIYDLAYYDEKLASMGVSSKPISAAEIDKIKYTKLNFPYRPLMNICKSIISNKTLSSDNGQTEAQAYFIDMAELWEIYLLTVLKRNLQGYEVSSPNTGFGEYLLNDNMRAIRPDILIKKDNKVVMIVDAKYKKYSKIGATSKDGISREDLYQMITYLYHYNLADSVKGIFTSPYKQEAEVKLHSFASNSMHRIGVINLPIKTITNSENLTKSIRELEWNYAMSIRNQLSRVTDGI